jgi:membrane protease YdiL (CAAX protease family)
MGRLPYNLETDMPDLVLEPSPVPSPAAANPLPRQAAPLRPMLILIGVFLAMALGGAMAQKQAAASTLALPAHPATVYFWLIVMEWGLVFYVWKAALGRRRDSLRDLIGGRWRTLRDVATDVLIGLVMWGAWSMVSLAWSSWAGADPAASIGSLMPHRPHEIALWIALSLSAGFSEELVFRGYLQGQFEALTGSAPLAVALQAALFGVSHGYQGVQSCMRITVYALLFGALAAWRRSLRPGMVAHAWTDIAAGLL